MIEERRERRAGYPATRSDGRVIRTATSETFERFVLQGSGPIVVEFMSYGCGHCRALEPVLQQVANLLNGKETVFKVNVAAEPMLAESYAIEGTPTFVMFLNGIERGRAAGAPPDVSSLLATVSEPFEQP